MRFLWAIVTVTFGLMFAVLLGAVLSDVGGEAIHNGHAEAFLFELLWLILSGAASLNAIAHVFEQRPASDKP